VSSSAGAALHHAGQVVPDLDAGVRFFTDVFGAEVDGPVHELGEGDAVAPTFGVDPAATMRFVFLELPGGGRLELVQWRAPGGADAPPRASDPGASHLALAVDDRDTAIRRARGHQGVQVLAPRDPFVFLVTPWGSYVQVIQRG
jgi:catechol 2,3-dioxygenase-like lactoylglutathione lyase family enzyme